MRKTYLAAYKMKLSIPTVGLLVFTPTFETESEIEQHAVETHEHYLNGNIRCTSNPEPQSAEEAPPETDYSKIHPFKLFPIARELGYPADGSRKKSDLLEFLQTQE